MEKSKTVRKYRLVWFLPLFAAASGGASAQTFDDVVAEFLGDQDTLLKAWAQETFKPFWERHVDKAIERCHPLLESLKPGETLSVRLLVDTEAQAGEPRIRDARPSLYSTCLSDQMQTLAWPRPPGGMRYLPIGLDLTSPEVEDKNADALIIEVLPGNEPRDAQPAK